MAKNGCIFCPITAAEKNVFEELHIQTFTITADFRNVKEHGFVIQLQKYCVSLHVTGMC